MTYIGIDNGSTGTVAILDGDTSIFVETPTTYMLNYQKSKVRHINRIDAPALKKLLEPYNPLSTRVVIERPMINSFRFQASIAAARSLEATLIVLESLHFGYEYVDSGAWQKVLLPAGVKGAPKLKKASKDVGLRMFPMHAEIIKEHGDADALLIAEWARRRGVYDYDEAVSCPALLLQDDVVLDMEDALLDDLRAVEGDVKPIIIHTRGEE